MKRALLLALGLSVTLTACGNHPAESSTPVPTAEGTAELPFSAEYTVVSTEGGTAHKETLIFEGTTENGIIKTLNFDVVVNKGQEDEYSKKDLDRYIMNTAYAEVTNTENGWGLAHLDLCGYTEALGIGTFTVYASAEHLGEDTVFGELNIRDGNGEAVELERALTMYQYLAAEGELTLTAQTPVKELLELFGLYTHDGFAGGHNRVSFAGAGGGRSYGEQLDAIVAHILANNMTLDNVYALFRTENQPTQSISDRDTVAGATITFSGDFQRLVYLALHGELFEGVTDRTAAGEALQYRVVTQGYGGEITTDIVVAPDGKITNITVVSDSETPTVGGLLTAENSDFLLTLLAKQEDTSLVETVSGATYTSNALIKAVNYARAAAGEQ